MRRSAPRTSTAAPAPSEELQIIDQKLDRYMARKAERRATTHLLIDRFRFDSFAPESDEAGSNLLTRFGHTVYLFFMITPPESIVERAWKRGLEVGRYKAVDDLLAHNIEAYAGMPQIFFTWALRADKEVHCEFLDNTVPFGERPRTIAFGWNGELNVLDVNAHAEHAGIPQGRRRREETRRPLSGPAMRSRRKTTRDSSSNARGGCRSVNFADPATGRIYLRHGRRACPSGPIANALRAAMADPDTRTGLAGGGAGHRARRTFRRRISRCISPRTSARSAFTRWADGDRVGDFERSADSRLRPSAVATFQIMKPATPNSMQPNTRFSVFTGQRCAIWRRPARAACWTPAMQNSAGM